MPFTEVRGIRIYHEIHGSGPRLLMITGTGRDLRHKPSPFDQPVAKHFQTLSYDQRGLGQSDKPDVPYTMADYGEDAGALLDALGWTSCVVMGTSFGGMVAQEFALRHPSKVERLVLACSSSGGAGGASYPLHEFESLPPLEAIRRHLEVSDTRRTAYWQKDNATAWQALIDDAVKKKQIGADEPGRAMGSRRQLEARIGHDTWARLPSLKMPVYICGGLYDGIASPENLRAMHRQIPHSKLDLFEGGHQFHAQDPKAWPAIIAFLQAKSG
jgi:3-oxoadipate enol-lactonase